MPNKVSELSHICGLVGKGEWGLAFMGARAAPTVHVLSTLSALFTKTLAINIPFVFTNISSPLHWNFSRTLSYVLKDAPHFLNNPIALQKKYFRLRGDPNIKKEEADLRKAVKATKTLATGIAFMFTYVWSPLHWHFSRDMSPMPSKIHPSSHSATPSHSFSSRVVQVKGFFYFFIFFKMKGKSSFA
jgi:hypothetical protein